MTRDEIIKAAEKFLKQDEDINLLQGPNPTLVYRRIYMDAIKHIHSLIALVPKEGMVVVPEEPTEEMKQAAAFTSISHSSDGFEDNFDYVSEDDAAEIYRKMLAAYENKETP